MGIEVLGDEVLRDEVVGEEVARDEPIYVRFYVGCTWKAEGGEGGKGECQKRERKEVGWMHYCFSFGRIFCDGERKWKAEIGITHKVTSFLYFSHERGHCGHSVKATVETVSVE